MKIEDQCCSLELAKRLKELGVKQASAFMWSYYPHVDKYDLEFRPGEQGAINVSAFTVAELGEKLPSNIEFRFFVGKPTGELHHISYNAETHIPRFYGDTEANARAKMLVYLLENNLISLPA
jgi:hypothetical protein